jgi:hypothetical protein
MAFADDLADLLAPLPPGIAATAGELASIVRTLRPDLKAKVSFGWKSVNFNHAQAGYVCCVYPAREHVALVFQHGRLLDHPRLTDDGKVKKVRWIPFEPGEAFDEDDLGMLLMQAIALRS